MRLRGRRGDAVIMAPAALHQPIQQVHLRRFISHSTIPGTPVRLPFAGRCGPVEGGEVNPPCALTVCRACVCKRRAKATAAACVQPVEASISAPLDHLVPVERLFTSAPRGRHVMYPPPHMTCMILLRRWHACILLLILHACILLRTSLTCTPHASRTARRHSARRVGALRKMRIPSGHWDGRAGAVPTCAQCPLTPPFQAAGAPCWTA
jgi:hypothetical protein